MAVNIRELKEKQPNVDNGHERYGGYSIQAFQRALRKKGFQLRYLNKLATYKNVSKKRWFHRISKSKMKHMIIIGEMHGCQVGTFHCIARTCIGEDYYCIDSDVYHYWKCSQVSLESFYKKIVAIYEIQHLVRP